MSSAVYNYKKNVRVNRLTDALILALRIGTGSELVPILGEDGDTTNRQAVFSWVVQFYEEYEDESDQELFLTLRKKLEYILLDFMSGH